jgi:hypothetical protein
MDGEDVTRGVPSSPYCLIPLQSLLAYVKTHNVDVSVAPWVQADLLQERKELWAPGNSTQSAVRP